MDAVLAIEHGADAIIVLVWRALRHAKQPLRRSNHGARQLPSAIPPIVALPAIVKAVAGRCPVFVDGTHECQKPVCLFFIHLEGGIRRGTDVLKALALGAKAVLIGRPILDGLAVDGENGNFRRTQPRQVWIFSTGFRRFCCLGATPIGIG